VVSSTPLPLYPWGKSCWYPLERRVGGPQSQSGLGIKEEKSLDLLGIDPGHPACSVVTTLSYSGF